MSRKVRVAAVQAHSVNGDIEGNLSRAFPFVREAAAAGAQLVLLPELLPTGFLMERRIWDFAECARGGPTVRWLRRTARTLRVWVGTSFLEADGVHGHFYNTFALASPDGSIVARVRKSPPASVEAYWYRDGGAAGQGGVERADRVASGVPGNPHVVDTHSDGFGSVGVCICYEGLLGGSFSRLVRDATATSASGADGVPDLMLQPFSAPVSQTDPWAYPDWAADELRRALELVPSTTTGLLGVPVVAANKSGPWTGGVPWPVPAWLMPGNFVGRSCIADGDGRVIARLGEGEQAFIVGDVTLDASRKAAASAVVDEASKRGHWAFAPGFRFSRLYRFTFPMNETLGAMWYGWWGLTGARVGAARAVTCACRPAGASAATATDDDGGDGDDVPCMCSARDKAAEARADSSMAARRVAAVGVAAALAAAAAGALVLATSASGNWGGGGAAAMRAWLPRRRT